jgi:hypothetical protein
VDRLLANYSVSHRSGRKIACPPRVDLSNVGPYIKRGNAHNRVVDSRASHRNALRYCVSALVLNALDAEHFSAVSTPYTFLPLPCPPYLSMGIVFVVCQ